MQRKGRLVALAGAGVAMAVIALELGVRAAGHRNWKRFRLARNEPAMHASDPVLGWRNRPGEYRYPGYVAGAPDVEVTILPDGSRRTARDAVSEGPEILLLGCSFAFGHAVSDRESLGWLLQERLPWGRVRNHAVSGYGTYQALLLLEEILAREAPPALVIYGFGESHELRSVADPGWLRSLAQFSRSGMAAVPWVALDRDGTLEHGLPTRYPSWPLRDYSALITLAQDRAATLAAAPRVADPWGATRTVLRAMDAAAASRGSRLLVSLLYVSPNAAPVVRADLDADGIRSANCTPGYPLASSERVEGEGHPNANVHRQWADCLARLATETLRGADPRRVARAD